MWVGVGERIGYFSWSCTWIRFQISPVESTFYYYLFIFQSKVSLLNDSFHESWVMTDGFVFVKKHNMKRKHLYFYGKWFGFSPKELGQPKLLGLITATQPNGWGWIKTRISFSFFLSLSICPTWLNLFPTTEIGRAAGAGLSGVDCHSVN